MFIQLNKLSSTPMTRETFRKVHKSFDKYTNKGRVRVKNNTDTSRFFPYFGYSGIRIKPGDTVDTYIRNCPSTTRTLDLRNRMLRDSAEGIFTIMEE